jgi:glycine betaine/choline ABC-type transport system substrate-binding protein
VTARQDNTPDPERCQEVWQRAKRSYRERYDMRLFPTLGIENTFALLVGRAPGASATRSWPPIAYRVRL